MAKRITNSWSKFELKGLNMIKPIVIDYIFNKVKRIDIEECTLN